MIEEGLKHTSTLTVTTKETAQSMGSGDLPVLATPSLVALMENAAMLAIAPELSEDETTVGGYIQITHLAPSPVGSTVKATAILVKVDGRRLYFDIEALEDDKRVGEAKHERFIVNRQKFMKKVSASN